MNFRKLIQKIGRINVVIIITVFSIFASCLITYSIYYIRQDFTGLYLAIVTAIIVPFIVAPLVSSPIVSLLMRIDQLEREMRELATHDFLTGLLNRREFYHNAENFIHFAEREKIPVSFIVLDLDNFKNINDIYGHPAGDEVLKYFSESVKSIVRKSDLVGRIGGEEFSILLPDTSIEAAVRFSERLHSVVRESVINHSHSSIRYTISMGLVTLVPEEEDSIESIVKRADELLYLAKENGRNRTEILNAA